MLAVAFVQSLPLSRPFQHTLRFGSNTPCGCTPCDDVDAKLQTKGQGEIKYVAMNLFKYLFAHKVALSTRRDFFLGQCK